MRYSALLDLAAGAVLLTAVLLVWRRELRAMVRLLSWQGAALASIPLVQGLHSQDAELVATAAIVFALRSLLLPWILAGAVRAEAGDRGPFPIAPWRRPRPDPELARNPARESTPLINTTASLLAAAGLTVLAFAVSRPLVALDPGPQTEAVPTALAVVLIAVFIMVSRRRAVSQAAGFLMLDNGITAMAFLTTAGVPFIVEIGASLDVLFAIVVIGVLTGRLRRVFGDTDLDQLRELRE